MFAPLFSLLGWFVLIAILLGVFKAFLPLIKGKFGEFAVAIHVKIYLKNPEYILLNNLTLADGQGSTTQIDHVLLSPYGLFVIETKNYKGWIFGGEYQKTWTQKIYKQSYKFQNPIHQNYKHIKVLEQILADIVEPELIHSIIVFMPEAELKTVMPTYVFRGAAWTDYVKTFKQEIMTETKIKRIRIRLEKEILEKSWKTDREHVKNLRQRK